MLYLKQIGRIAHNDLEFYLQGLLPKILAIYMYQIKVRIAATQSPLCGVQVSWSQNSLITVAYFPSCF